VWQYLSEHLKDDEGTTAGAKPTNRSNRFEVADRINALLSPDAKKTGPFWCASEGAACQYSAKGSLSRSKLRKATLSGDCA
jgi:hypothetical protein